MFLVMVALLQFVVNLNGELMNYNLITASIKTLYMPWRVYNEW